MPTLTPTDQFDRTMKMDIHKVVRELNNVLGLRLNVWTSIVLFTGALVYFVVAGRRHPRPDTREESVWLPGREPASEATETGESDLVQDPSREM